MKTSNTIEDFLLADDLSRLPSLNGEQGTSITCEEEPVVLNNAIATKLRLLLKIVDFVENPGFAVSFEEILDIVQDLGIKLLYSSDLERLNPEVFEDPGQHPDSLGNIRMIHKPMSKPDSEQLKLLGKALLDLIHAHFAVFVKHKQLHLKVADLDIGMVDDIASEDILAAKRLIRDLRRENNRLDRRNEALYIQKSQLQEAVDFLKPLKEGCKSLPKKSDFLHSFGTDESGKLRYSAYDENSHSSVKPPIIQLEKEDTKPITVKSGEEDGKLLSTTRNRGQGSHSDSSQTEFSFGE